MQTQPIYVPCKSMCFLANEHSPIYIKVCISILTIEIHLSDNHDIFGTEYRSYIQIRLRIINYLYKFKSINKYQHYICKEKNVDI